MARALVTGASSGIGKDIAKELSKRGYDLILVARNQEKLEELKSKLNTNVEIIPMDISIKEKCIKLHDMVGYVDILVNNAGFGVFGKFTNTDLDREIQLIQTNITAVHILTKLFLKDMVSKNSGYILNVASIAGHLPGPLMATYYASKHYVYTLSTSINEELKKDKLNVRVGTLNPGPVRTNFNNVANVKFEIKSISSDYAAKYAIDKMFKNKLVIIPTFYMKGLVFLTRLTPTKLLARIAYNIQNKKR